MTDIQRVFSIFWISMLQDLEFRYLVDYRITEMWKWLLPSDKTNADIHQLYQEDTYAKTFNYGVIHVIS
jgi:hypothetical protein